jgi:L-2-hydroxyglutarate oxidase LhgO
MDEFDCVVVGAGVVGLAAARALALDGREVLVLDAAEGIGTETSSRNSEVIHAGIYYPAGSLMARACVEGKHMLYEYCQDRGVPYARCGKLIVATNEEEAGKLEAIQGRAAANGVPDLALLRREEAVAMEPALSCTAALLSPSTGIIDSHAYMLALQGDAENAGAVFAFHSPVASGRVGPTASRSRSAAPSPQSCDAAPWSTRPACTRRGWPAPSRGCRRTPCLALGTPKATTSP